MSLRCSKITAPANTLPRAAPSRRSYNKIHQTNPIISACAYRHNKFIWMHLESKGLRITWARMLIIVCFASEQLNRSSDEGGLHCVFLSIQRTAFGIGGKSRFWFSVKIKGVSLNPLVFWFISITCHKAYLCNNKTLYKKR